jgi:glycosyltransferase involved in cell wall biosynthesis
MRVLLIVDVYPPSRISGAIQMHDLAVELANRGLKPTVIVPSSELSKTWSLEERDGVEVLRVSAAPMKDVALVRRAIGEFLLPFAMLRGLTRSPLASVRWDGLVWYSPTIFFGPMIYWLKRKHGCRAYLILRDVFPDWAVDTGVMRKGVAYRCFKLIERFQYAVADVIGVQTRANMAYLHDLALKPAQRLEVLNNWLSQRPVNEKSDLLGAMSLADRAIVFVYAGNMGVAQGMDCMIDLAERLKDMPEVGFLFVGRGTEVPRLQAAVAQRAIDNIVFHDEIEPSEIPGLLAQCHIGLLALDPRHKTHNIPGKFLTYLCAGLPVLARINAGNDLEALIDEQGVGKVCVGGSIDRLYELAVELIAHPAERSAMAMRGRKLSESMFSVAGAATQVIAGLHQ